MSKIPIIIVGAAGKMGRRLVALATEYSELQIIGCVEHPTHPSVGQDAGKIAGISEIGVLISDNLSKVIRADSIIIDFSHPANIEDRLLCAKNHQCGYVLGTTGFTEEQKQRLRNIMAGGRLVFAYNFSVGVNLLISLCRQVASVLGPNYDVEIIEVHHNQKVDAPSGTAEKLAEAVAQGRNLHLQDVACYGRKGQVGKRPPNEIGIHAIRCGDVVGEHTVIFATGGERIELTHRASSRDAFARGALRAAIFLAHAPPGEYDMRKILNLPE